MTWRLRQLLPKHFALNFGDADPVSNQRLQEYEALQFLNSNPDALVAIEKTQTYGDLYDTVLFGDQAINYPRPFLFSLTGMERHPNFAVPRRLSRVVCLYDNAGESFLPGQDAPTSPVTRHLAMSQALLFLFDPTQDMRLRQACHGQTDDPQMKQRSQRLRARAAGAAGDDLAGGGPARAALCRPGPKRQAPPAAGRGGNEVRLLVVAFEPRSAGAALGCRRKTVDLGPPLGRDRADVPADPGFALAANAELVAAAEGFAENVVYVPVSTTGRGPETDPVTGAFGIRPRDIAPQWVEVPLLYVLGRWMPGIIPLYDQAASRRQAMLPPATPPAASAGGAGHALRRVHAQSATTGSRAGRVRGRTTAAAAEGRAVSYELVYTSARRACGRARRASAWSPARRGSAPNWPTDSKPQRLPPRTELAGGPAGT